MANELELSLMNLHSPLVQNLSKAERLAIDELKNNKEIIIKSADKGSAVVTMNTLDYIQDLNVTFSAVKGMGLMQIQLDSCLASMKR